MGIGRQDFSLQREGKVVFSETSPRDVEDKCPCGIYNYNAYVGTVPCEETVNVLESAGMGSLRLGLKVDGC